MTPFIANTDRAWFDFLSTRAAGQPIDEVNFWQPKSTRPMKRMTPGEPVFLRLKAPTRAIAGVGFFAHFRCVRVEDAWPFFGWRNGDDSQASFLRRLSGYRGVDLSVPANRKEIMGCTILRDARFWPDHTWIPWGAAEGWADNIVQGKTETDAWRAERLMQALRRDQIERPRDLLDAFHPLDVDRRTYEERTVAQRQGQTTFRLRLLDAYGRCAITGERTEPVLDAAHIQPYLGPESNHVQNGLLLSKEFHTLFDRGYVTVTPDYQIRVSDALREEWQNGKRFYDYDHKPLLVLPREDDHRPSRDALAWHSEQVFLG